MWEDVKKAYDELIHALSVLASRSEVLAARTENYQITDAKAREREEEHAADAANARLLLSRWRQKRGYVISEKAQTLLHELESDLYGCWAGGGPAEFYYSEAQGLYRSTLQGIVEEQRHNT